MYHISCTGSVGKRLGCFAGAQTGPAPPEAWGGSTEEFRGGYFVPELGLLAGGADFGSSRRCATLLRLMIAQRITSLLRLNTASL